MDRARKLRRVRAAGRTPLGGARSCRSRRHRVARSECARVPRPQCRARRGRAPARAGPGARSGRGAARPRRGQRSVGSSTAHLAGGDGGRAAGGPDRRRRRHRSLRAGRAAGAPERLPRAGRVRPGAARNQPGAGHLAGPRGTAHHRHRPGSGSVAICTGALGCASRVASAELHAHPGRVQPGRSARWSRPRTTASGVSSTHARGSWCQSCAATAGRSAWSISARTASASSPVAQTGPRVCGTGAAGSSWPSLAATAADFAPRSSLPTDRAWQPQPRTGRSRYGMRERARRGARWTGTRRP